MNYFRKQIKYSETKPHQENLGIQIIYVHCLLTTLLASLLCYRTNHYSYILLSYKQPCFYQGWRERKTI